MQNQCVLRSAHGLGSHLCKLQRSTLKIGMIVFDPSKEVISICAVKGAVIEKFLALFCCQCPLLLFWLKSGNKIFDIQFVHVWDYTYLIPFLSGYVEGDCHRLGRMEPDNPSRI